MSNNRFLVIARVGDKSLHQEWLKPSKYKNFDVYLEYYGDGSNDFKADADFYSEAKETKWPRIYQIIKEWGEDLLRYDAIWIPDDDIRTDARTIHKMFRMFMRYNLLLAQPALTKDSYYSHKITLVRKRYKLRYTSYVEVMVPIFSRDALQLLFETFKKSQSGWGLDSVWPTILGKPIDKIAILDKFPVAHTRKVGNGTLYKDIQGSSWDELDSVCKEYGVDDPFDYTTHARIKRKRK